MHRALLRLLMLCSAALVASGCREPLAPGPEAMILEVVKRDVGRLHVSFSAQVTGWDGKASIHYWASACASSGDLFICMGDPFVEDSVHASTMLQPITWTEQQCGYLIVFEASISNGEKEEATHVTCS